MLPHLDASNPFILSHLRRVAKGREAQLEKPVNTTVCIIIGLLLLAFALHTALRVLL